MNSFKTLAATMALAMVAGLATAAKAQTPAPTTAPAAAKEGVVTQETLKTMLTNLGYDLEEKKVGDKTYLYVNVERGGLKYQMSVNLSGSGEKLWTSTTLAVLPEGMEPPSARLLKLLELNQTTTGPSHFAYTPASRRISIQRPMDNRGVTPKALKDHIDGLADHCATTRDHWDISKWEEIKSAAAPK